MGVKRIEVVTESMFYTLMAFMKGGCSGAEAAVFVEKTTNGRVHLGPATLYTILGRFEEEGVLREVRTEGRKRFYMLTEKGRNMYTDEIARMELCLQNARQGQKGDVQE